MCEGYRALFTTAVFTAFCSMSFAYTLTGTVSDTGGGAVKGADVVLLSKGKSTTTDSMGKFIFQEDDPAGILPSQYLGSFSLNNGVLHFSQNGSIPTQVKIFDLMGNQIFTTLLQGSGIVDLNSFIETQGVYLAHIKMGSAQESFRFTSRKNHSGSVFYKKQRILFKTQGETETLQISAEGFDTLKVFLSNLDTALNLTLNKSSSVEPQYSFGWGLKNTPVPSKGCGKQSSLQAIQKVENGEKFQINVGGTNRQFFITLPKNYDKTKPYKLLVANHCMGSKAEDFVHHSPDYDHPSPYYGQQNLDAEGNYIFAAPQGDDSGMWTKGQADHEFFGQMLTTIEDNYCIDTSRVFATGFSFGAMFTNSLAQSFQHRLRAVAVYAVADYNIWLPDNAGKPIAWMGIHGKNDQICNYDRAKTSALPRILKNNGPDGTDVSSEKPEEFQGSAGHLCYDFKNVDPRFPVKWCSWNGGHQWTAHDGGNTSVGAGWENTWVPDVVHEFFEQF